MKIPSLLVIMMVCASGLLPAESAPQTNEPLASSSPEAKTDLPPQYLLAFGKVTIGGKQIETAIQWNTKTGEARMLNAASFSDKSSGQEGNLIGWVPLVDLQQAVQKLSTDISARQVK